MYKKLKSLSVLFVDDNMEMLKHAQEVLEIVFNRVYISSNGCEAIEIVKTYFPDVIISDFKRLLAIIISGAT
jgi:CheY-like chemotaxis protein